ncbi:desulfoferrodoxin FeS4 iron-binding domain-containing protein [Patescibacteria group bacterium]|nr:desulfoferrodoxin FeS4 iron-binding domain-containing protein [Patescibacteria group bacterium]
MTELNKNYKCSICGNLVKVLQAGIGELVCCGQPMNIVIEEVSIEQKPMGEESPTIAEPTPSEQTEQSMPPVSETPTPEENQGV